MSSIETLESGLSRLAEIIEKTVESADGYRRVGPLWAMRWAQISEPAHGIYAPMLCVIAQGSKRLLVGEERFIYNTGRYLLNSVTVPAAGQVIEASPESPCLWMMIELDPALIMAVIAEADLATPASEAPSRAMDAGCLTLGILEAVVRLATVFEVPDHADFLLPLRLKEVIFQVLLSDQGVRLRQIATSGSAQRVAQAVDWIKGNYARPMTIESLAQTCNMSPSALHKHFKIVTAMSPLQFLKQIRLQEAMRLMVSEGLDAASAGYQVGYEDPAYFSRDYRRHFGDPPRRHTEKMRNTKSYAV